MVDTRSILISLEDLKRMKLNENQLKLTIYLIDYYVLKEKQKPRGIVSLQHKKREVKTSLIYILHFYIYADFLILLIFNLTT